MNTSKNLVDSSGWIEYFTGSDHADFFSSAIEDTKNLIVSSINLLEVFKWILRERGQSAALSVAAVMQEAEVVPLDAALSIDAARLGMEYRLPLADSIVLATARMHNALLWTQDSDFEHISDVRYCPKGQ